MSVGISAIIGHQLTKKSLLHLPVMLEKWAIANTNKISAKWDVNYNMTEAILETIWLDWENDLNPGCDEVFDNSIVSSFGRIAVWRNTIVICPKAYHYYNFCDPIRASQIILSNRTIAQNLNATTIVYTTDSAYPTSAIAEKAQSGYTMNELIQFGIRQFGNPPKPISEGVKYFFFIDEINSEIGILESWNINTDSYWKRNTITNKYELKAQ